MSAIRECMTKDPITLDETSSLTEAAQCMETHHIGDVIVMTDGKACGLVTDRDIVVRAIAKGKDPQQTRLGDICDKTLFSVGPEDDVGDVLRLMRNKAIRRVPVMENGKAVGIVSLGDLAQQLDPGSVLGEVSAAPPR